MTPVLQLVGVGKSYRRRAALHSVDLAIEPGTVLGVVGGNGSGKSTLLRIAAGVSRPTAGRVVGAPSVGYLPDRFPAAQRLSGRSYLRHLAAIRGLTDLGTVDRLLERLDLVGGPNTPMHRLSKGNAQKLGLAQAVLGDPELLVLDEPWSGLDVSTHRLLTDLITETRAAGRAVLFADHSTDTVERLADRVVEATDGRVRTLGPAGPGTAGPTPAGPSMTTALPAGTIRIELAGGDPAALAAIAGVRRCEADADGVTTVLGVDPARSDAVLAEALRRGCSVRGVRPW